jgi:hypothetical protein
MGRRGGGALFLSDAAEGGQIFMSQATTSLLEDRI